MEKGATCVITRKGKLGDEWLFSAGRRGFQYRRVRERNWYTGGRRRGSLSKGINKEGIGSGIKNKLPSCTVDADAV